MGSWLFYAILAMIFAGITAILAKYGLKNTNADLALGIRTAIIFIAVIGFDLFTNKFKHLSELKGKEVIFLVLSGIATTLSWVFYFRAIKNGPVSYVTVIDKSSILITLILAFILLKEPFTPKLAIGGGLILAGLAVLL